MKFAYLIGAAALAIAAAPAHAQSAPAEPRVNQLIVYGDDPCPPSTDEEITVCAKLPEGERFRIPPNLRDLDNPRSQSWTNRAVELSYVGRGGIGSCTPVGPGGNVGCFNQLVAQARADREGRDEVRWNELIEQARRERLSRIDADAEAVEQEEREREQPR